ncbi:DUF4166 domain-containing protein [Micrococcales bacterium 31B]|nr:DUF4166 domain-containing protein [Micrococcales bacterium 31B]
MNQPTRASIFHRALGADAYARLHPEVRRHFDASLANDQVAVGRGVMQRIWHGADARFSWVRFALRYGGVALGLAPAAGRDVAFEIVNVPVRDAAGREAIASARTFAGERRGFDTVTTLEPSGLVDTMGPRGCLATSMRISERDGSLVLRSVGTRLRLGRLAVPLPFLAGTETEAREWFDTETGRLRISVRVASRWLGPLFGYEGDFAVRVVDASAPETQRGLRSVRGGGARA